MVEKYILAGAFGISPLSTKRSTLLENHTHHVKYWRYLFFLKTPPDWASVLNRDGVTTMSSEEDGAPPATPSRGS